MKNTKRVLRASEAERIRQLLEDIYFDLETQYIDIREERDDDPGDYDKDTERMENIARKQNRILKAAEPVGGLDTVIIRHRVYTEIFG